jgi:hypothetical protein
MMIMSSRAFLMILAIRHCDRRSIQQKQSLILNENDDVARVDKGGRVRLAILRRRENLLQAEVEDGRK